MAKAEKTDNGEDFNLSEVLRAQHLIMRHMERLNAETLRIRIEGEKGTFTLTGKLDYKEVRE